MAKKRRPCPRGLHDGCPIPRELCSEDYERTGHWHCLKFLREFEWFVFGTGEEEPEHHTTESDAMAGEEIVSLEDLMRVLEGMEEET
ncbi:MAG: hypothetical protein QGG64_04995 [Candidatus Latescibacteria bacterium]|nr:hypothetical protein [Candidatus Latescibacterota bacterium]